MKKYLIMAMAAAAITSCSQDEVMEIAEKQAISFKDAFVENATRAIDGSYNNNKLPSTFLVYGNTQGNEKDSEGNVIAPVVPIFAGVEVKKGGTGTGIDYKYDAQYTQYWIPNNTYSFAAVVDAGSVDIATNGLPTQINYATSTQKDLLYATATATGKVSGNEEIKFAFNHLLSRSQFTIKNMITTNTAGRMYTYRVSDIKMHSIYDGGFYTVADETWNFPQNPTYIVLDFGNATGAAETANPATASTEAILIGKEGAEHHVTSHYQRLVIPAVYGESNKFKVTCTIETLLNGEVVDVNNFEKDIQYTFEAGIGYNFIIALEEPGEPIMFSVAEVTDWL